MLCIFLHPTPPSHTHTLPPPLTPFNPQQFLAHKTQQTHLKHLFLGYPANHNPPPKNFFKWKQQLLTAGIGKQGFNNAGNPHEKEIQPYNTLTLEKEVIQYFGKTIGFQDHNIWGYCSSSGTESNLHGLYMGRTLLKGKTGLMPKIYFTSEAHYSIEIIADLLTLDSVRINAHTDGSINTEDLKEKLVPTHPALLLATVGTTFKGAIDPLPTLKSLLQNIPHYIHVDAALFGGYLPHTNQAHVLSPTLNNTPLYDSLAISCHKFFGFPYPAGLFITSNTHFQHFLSFFSNTHNPDYIHQIPGLIFCSRDASKPAEFFFFTTPESVQQQKKDTTSILNLTSFLMEQLLHHLPQLSPQRASSVSNIITFKKPSQPLITKYSLATTSTDLEGTTQPCAHVVIMPHTNQNALEEFLNDLIRENS